MEMLWTVPPSKASELKDKDRAFVLWHGGINPKDRNVYAHCRSYPAEKEYNMATSYQKSSFDG